MSRRSEREIAGGSWHEARYGRMRRRVPRKGGTVNTEVERGGPYNTKVV